jgi:hypothetical protein
MSNDKLSMAEYFWGTSVKPPDLVVILTRKLDWREKSERGQNTQPTTNRSQAGNFVPLVAFWLANYGFAKSTIFIFL